MLRVLIVDGAPLARAHIARMLESRRDYRVVAKLHTATSAVNALRSTRYKLAEACARTLSSWIRT